jgi:Na+-transporting NADH:ubiquinone oxidoreductase subunit C
VQQSNTYILGFVLVLCVLIGGILAGASRVLGPAQQKSIELETKSQILGAVRSFVGEPTGANVLDIYKQRITSIVVNYDGEEVTQDAKGASLVAEKVDVSANYKKAPQDRLYPVYKLVSEKDKSNIEAYIVPVYGSGLWDKIWGYVALDANVEAIVGTSFDHKGETPGLGQRIATHEIQDRFIGKKIYDEKGKLVSVRMMKGEHGGGKGSVDYYKDDPHEVDGMSGATLTGNGLNQMLKAYMLGYRNFFKRIKSSATAVATTK